MYWKRYNELQLLWFRNWWLPLLFYYKHYCTTKYTKIWKSQEFYDLDQSFKWGEYSPNKKEREFHCLRERNFVKPLQKEWNMGFNSLNQSKKSEKNKNAGENPAKEWNYTLWWSYFGRSWKEDKSWTSYLTLEFCTYQV